MMYHDELRKIILKDFCELYCLGDEDVILSKMPLSREDQEGEKFIDYFNFIQTLYALQGEPTVNRKEVEALRLKFEQYNFPKQQLIGLLGVSKHEI